MIPQYTSWTAWVMVSSVATAAPFACRADTACSALPLRIAASSASFIAMGHLHAEAYSSPRRPTRRFRDVATGLKGPRYGSASTLQPSCSRRTLVHPGKRVRLEDERRRWQSGVRSGFGTAHHARRFLQPDSFPLIRW